jgi:TonB family protein
MKRYVIFLAIELVAATVAGQNNKSGYLTESRTTSPEFMVGETFVQGGHIESLNDYLNKMVQYPQQSVQCCLQGTEVVEFTVTSTGEVTAFNVINSVCPKIDEEVIRAIKSTGGKWMPGTVNNEPADMKQEISVVFQLCSDREFINRAKQFAQKGNKLLFDQNKPAQALKYFNRAIIYLPSEENLLAARGLCLFNLGDTTGAMNDWQRILVLEERNGSAVNHDELISQVTLSQKFEVIIKK